MKKTMTKMACMLLMAGMISGMAVSCSDDDPGYVEPPVVEVTKATIGGMVTAISGAPIQGANVTAVCGSMTVTAQTDAQGVFVLEGLTQAGTYAMTAAAEGKLEAAGSVEVKAGETVTWNARLANEGKEVEVKAEEETVVVEVAETSADNEEVEIVSTTVIPPAAVDDEDAKIIITLLYSEENHEAVSRATTNTEAWIIGVDIACTNPDARLTKPISKTFQLDPSVASLVKVQKDVNGSWQDMDMVQDNGNVIIEIDEFTSYHLSLPVQITTSSSSENLSFSQMEYDNLFGKSDMYVGNAPYTYKVGAEITANVSGVLGGYLREFLGNYMKTSVAQTVTGNYPLNVTLPVGTALKLSGKQAFETVSVKSENVSVSGKVYGDVSIDVTTYNREHTGSGSGN